MFARLMYYVSLLPLLYVSVPNLGSLLYVILDAFSLRCYITKEEDDYDLDIKNTMIRKIAQ